MAAIFRKNSPQPEKPKKNIDKEITKSCPDCGEADSIRQCRDDPRVGFGAKIPASRAKFSPC
jgi:hypothetical protein